MHKTIAQLRAENDTGIIAAENLIVHDPIHKQHFTQQQLQKRELALDSDYSFVAGTCFAARVELVKRIHALGLTIADFEPSETGYFSFAYAMERYLTAGTCGKYQMKGVSVCGLRRLTRSAGEKWQQRLNGLRLCSDPRFELSDDFVLRWLEHHIVWKYELVSVPFGSISRLSPDCTTVPLVESEPYRFLVGQTADYVHYCEARRRTDYMMLSEDEYVREAREHCINRYQSLINALEQAPYDERRVIVVDQGNIAMDGQHRAAILLHMYGPDHRVTVLKIYGSILYQCKNIMKRYLYRHPRIATLMGRQDLAV